MSNLCELLPGDVIITGTPGGVALKRGPSSYLKDGDLVEVEISCIGVLSNRVRDETGASLAA
ncbi:MAG: fumarylacetoacetate hydrolase family protein [Mesorhizobium sp.]|nr:MAG: fumarylacetoacetate hydrolase family protein [Mesorhizobium sp.]